MEHVTVREDYITFSILPFVVVEMYICSLSITYELMIVVVDNTHTCNVHVQQQYMLDNLS